MNTDGWRQTKLAWLAIFPAIFVVRCFLHAYMRIRDRCKSTSVFTEIRAMIWHIYHARSYVTYWRRYRKFLIFARDHLTGEALKALNKFEKKRAELYKGWLYPGAMPVKVTPHVEAACHGLHMAFQHRADTMRNTAHLLIRGWTLLHNFQPYCHRARARSQSPYCSPFHKLNQKQDHDC